MTIYSKFNIVYHLQKWMDSVPGQTFLNYAYSWGASVVILGTLFKLTHLPGANIMLFAGMGTEVFVFFISAFDRPFDKTQEGRDLPTHIDEEEIDREEAEAEAAYNAGVQGSVIIGGGAAGSGAGVAGSGAGVSGGGTIIIGGGAASAAASATAPASEGAAQTVAGGTQTVVSPEAAQTAAAAAELAANHEVAMQLADAQANYLDELKRLTETLQKVSDQSVRLTRDSEEMENMNRTLTGINRFYEMQLKSVGTQSATIDEVNEQTRKLAGQLQELNEVYTKMVEALKMKIA